MPKGPEMAAIVLVIVWTVAIGSVVANAFDLPVRWRLGRHERRVMYVAVFLGGGAFWTVVFTSESVVTIVPLIASVIVMPLAGMMIGKVVRQ
jgi:hypothetical protein